VDRRLGVIHSDAEVNGSIAALDEVGQLADGDGKAAP
jgi:hypothetical protein